MRACYRSLARWKYQTVEDFRVTLPELRGAASFSVPNTNPLVAVDTVFAFDAATTTLTIWRSYCWDGPSGPTLDSSDTMRGSLVHDVLYQAIRMGLLPASYRLAADNVLYRICREDGMGELRAQAWLKGVRWFAGYAARPKPDGERSVTRCVGLDD